MQENQPATRYRVEYLIDVTADSPIEAARAVHDCLQDPRTIALLFVVTEIDEDGDDVGEPVTVDLWNKKVMPRGSNPADN